MSKSIEPANPEKNVIMMDVNLTQEILLNQQNHDQARIKDVALYHLPC